MHTSSAPADPGGRTGVEDRRTAVASGVTTLAVLGVAFGAMALGIPYFWVAFPVGFGGILPLVVAYTRRRDGSNGRTRTVDADGLSTDAARDPRDEALQRLRTRYARGELTDDVFEARLERLLETETVAAATDWTRSGRRRERENAVGASRD